MKCRYALRSASRPMPHRFFNLALLAVMLGSMLSYGAGRVFARESRDENGPSRQVIEQTYGSVNHWLVKAWADQSVKCELFLKEAVQPAEEDIRLACGDQLAKDWAATPACDASMDEDNLNSCAGLYLVYLGNREISYQTVVQLPLAEAHYELENCSNGAWCNERPVFRFYGLEPLDNEEIQAVKVRSGTKVAACQPASDCRISVPTTTEHGTWLEYWVESSYGDESEHQYLLVRNVYQASTPSRYYLEVLSPEFTRDTAELQWSSFPSLGHPNAAIYSSINAINSLFTNDHLYYLSGKLINSGEVDTRRCSSSLLLSNGNAGTCGEEIAYEDVVQWQNQYNQQILDASHTYGLPARILKGILAQESQFWPDPQIPYEYGLGSLTEKGVDSLLVTDSTSFLDVCLSTLDKEDCAAGYASLTSKQQAEIRGLVLQAVGTDDEIDLIARVLLSQIVQVGQVTQDVTKNLPGQVVSYEDLWDLTIASYHAGVGCITEGLQELKDTDQKITFEQYCKVAPKGCQSACTFTQKVKNYAAQNTSASVSN